MEALKEMERELMLTLAAKNEQGQYVTFQASGTMQKGTPEELAEILKLINEGDGHRIWHFFSLFEKDKI